MTTPVETLIQNFWASPSEDTFGPLRDTCRQDPKNIRNLTAWFNTALHLKLFDDAQQALEHLQTQFPHNPSAKMWTVSLRLANKDLDAAAAGFRDLTPAQKNNPDFIRQWVHTCGQAGYIDGLELARPLLDDLPDGLQKHWATAGLAFFTQDMETAAASYRKMLALKPDHVGAILKLAEIAEAQGAPSEARAVLTAALDQAPDLFQIRRKLYAMTAWPSRTR